MRFMKTTKACLSLFRIRFAESTQYRLATLSQASVSIFLAWIELIVYTAFFLHSSIDQGTNSMSLAQTVSYIWLGQFLFPLQPLSIDGEILSSITSGNVGIELCRPIDLYTHWFSKTAAQRLSGFWMRGIIIVLVGFVMPLSFRLSLPVSLAGFGLFLLSALSAFLLCNAFGMLTTAVRLGITWGEGPTYIMMLIPAVLSGGYLPLQLWPEFMQKFLFLQPFSGYLDIPTRLYIGTLAPHKAGWAILLQLAWAGIFVAAGKMLMHRKMKSLIIQGG